MAATTTKKAAAKKPAEPEVPEAVEVDFTYDKETKGTYVWSEVADEDGAVVIGKVYTKKPFFKSFVPTAKTTITVTIEVSAN